MYPVGESADDDEEEDEDEETVDSLTAAEALALEPGELSALDREVSGVELRSMESSAFELELQLISSGEVQPPPPVTVEPLASQTQLPQARTVSSQVVMHMHLGHTHTHTHTHTHLSISENARNTPHYI